MHIQGQNRNQGTLFPERLDELIGEDNAVRVIDAFVDALNLVKLGFNKAKSAATGRPPYHPGDLLKLFVYGYLHQIRSTRRLERECHRNVELLWLLNRLAPDFKTIANFRADNPKALVKVCRAFVQFCRTQELYGGELIAIDGSKFQANSSNDKVTKPAQLKKRLAQVERQIKEWLESLGRSEKEEVALGGGDTHRTQAALKALESERDGLTERLDQMQREGLRAQADTDRDARLMKGAGIGYNVQSSVDDKHHLIVDHEVVQEASDQQQLYRMARRSQKQLDNNGLTVLADRGYSNGKLLSKCESNGMEVYVPVKRSINNTGDQSYFDRSEFRYHREDDEYECPAGKRLRKKNKSTRNRCFMYTTEACAECALKWQCTAAKQRWVTRHFEEDTLEQVAKRTADNPMMMRRRKGIVEHPFGTLKGRMDGGRFLVRGLKKVKAEMALAVTAYNLTRAINVLGVRQLCRALAV